MPESDPSSQSFPRRSVLKGAGLGLGAGLLSGMAPAAAADGDVQGQAYWAHKGRVKLFLWRKRLGVPGPGQPARPVVFLRARVVQCLTHVL